MRVSKINAPKSFGEAYSIFPSPKKETANKQFGILQIIEQKNIVSVVSGSDVVSLSFRAKVTDASKLSRIKAAIISWNSTPDAPTSDIVSAWNAEGTKPTLVSNWTYENSPVDLNLTTSDAEYKIENISIDTSGVANIGIFIWSDDVATNDTTGKFLEISEVNLVKGAVAQGVF